MKLAVKILAAIFLVFGTGLYYLTHGMMENIRTRYLEGVEETLVDQAEILAQMVGYDIEHKRFSERSMHRIFDSAYDRELFSKIYALEKKRVDLRVYITDEKGIIVFDSSRKAAPGEDYSSWRDVFLTLNGRYGARSSRDPLSKDGASVLYVAAPILVKGKIKGVLTVGKPTTGINHFLVMARAKIKLRTGMTIGFILVFSILAVVFITRPIKRLTRYAQDVRAGIKTQLPNLDQSEIGDMGRAFEKMRIALENRQYVENYVQALTHEIKSPLSAIKGAAELLEEDMPPRQRSRFIHNIRNESDRIKDLVDRMLALASIENMKAPGKVHQIIFSDLVNEVEDRIQPVLGKKNIQLTKRINTGIMVEGNPFLLKLALSNLLENSLDFSPENSEIHLITSFSRGVLTLEIKDSGPGIPGYAADKIFEKFFSLQRPGSGKKSTGLGLNFVKEIALLHKGEVTLTNRSSSGACARFSMPGQTGG